MSDYRVTITTVKEKCPFDAKRKSKEYCKVCKAWKDPCSGLGIETTISSRKIGEDKMKQEIESNYRQIKSDVLSIVENEMERIKNDPNLQHLIQKE